jgi:hypothetical protein
MKIKEIIYDLLIEDVKNKNLFGKIITKWQTECPELSNEDAEKIFERHENIKNSIKEDAPSVISFLSRYDGNHGTQRYVFTDLLDITRLPVEKLVEFLIEFGKFYIDFPCGKKDEVTNKERQEELKKIFNENGPQKTPEKIEESRKMWFDESSTIINENGFRVYPIMNQQQSIRMGYYYQTLHKKAYLQNVGRMVVNAPWCVTWRGGDVKEYREDENGKEYGAPIFSHGGNMYGSYRKGSNRTFYFVIDESKDTLDKYYMSALQIIPNGSYILSSMYNDGDTGMKWDQIVNIYPKITNFRDLIANREMDDDELESVSILDRINEVPGSPNEFARQTLQVKDDYISNGGTIKQVKSWNSMSPDLKTKYIDMMTVPDITTRISNYELFNSIMKTEGYQKKIDRKLRNLGKEEGISFIVDNFMKTEFDIVMENISNKGIRLLQSKNTRKYGLFNSFKNEWVTLNGVEYGVFYKKIENKIVVDDNGTSYILQIFSNSTQPNQQSFYCLFDVDTEVSRDRLQPAYFISKNKWDDLINSDKIIDDEDLVTSSDVNLDTDTDIKEMFK